jgi:hypothetical protein
MVNRIKETNTVMRYKANDVDVLVLPIIRQDRSLAGVIEVEHDSCLPDYRVEEQIRVVSSIGAVAIGTHLLD